MIRASFKEFLNIYKGDNAKCVEVGVNEGYNAEAMLLHNKDIHLTLVDFYDVYDKRQDPVEAEEMYKQMCKRVQPFKDRVNIIRKESHHAAKLFDNESLDYVYIDANHSKDAVRLDIVSWFPKVKLGGMISGHDQNQVVEHIRDLLSSIVTERLGLDWWMIKTRSSDIPVELQRQFIEEYAKLRKEYMQCQT